MSEKQVQKIKVTFGVNEEYLQGVALNSLDGAVQEQARASLRDAVSYETEFKPPYKLKDSGLEILMFKHLLGTVVDLRKYDVEDKGWFGKRKNRNTPATQRNSKLSINDGYQFDEKMLAALIAWQTDNRSRIIEYGQLVLGWPSDQEGAGKKFSEILNLGQIEKATLAVMHGFRSRDGYEHVYSRGFGPPPSVTIPGDGEKKQKGQPLDNPPPTPSHLYTAVRAVWQIVYDDSGASLDPNKSAPNQEAAAKKAFKALMAPKPSSNSEPWEETSGDISIYVDTEFTEKNPPSFSNAQQVVEYFREKEAEALRRIFQYYGKAQSWGPLDLVDDKEALRLYGDTIPNPNPMTIGAPTGELVPYYVVEASSAVRRHSQKNKIKPLIWADDISGDTMSGLHVALYDELINDNPANWDDIAAPIFAINYFRMPTPRPGDVYRIQFTVSVEKMRLSRSSSASSLGDAYMDARLAYARAAGMIDAAGEFLKDPQAAIGEALDNMHERIDNAAKNAEEFVDSKLRYASKNKKKVARNAWKALRRDTEKRRADAKWEKSEALAAATVRKEISFPIEVWFEARNFKKHIEAVATQMEEYGKEIREWQRPTKGSKKKRTGGGNFYPPVHMDKEAKALRDCIPAVENILSRSGLRLRDKFGEKIGITFIPEKNKASQITGASILKVKYLAAAPDDLLGTGAAASFAGKDTREAMSERFIQDSTTVEGAARAIREANEFLEAEAKRTVEITTGRESWLSVPVDVGDAREPGSDPPRSPKIKHPFSNARTMAYLMQLSEMYDYINKPADFGASCDEVLAPKAIPFTRKFTYPPPGIKPRVKDNYAGTGTGDGRSINQKISTELRTTELKLLSQIKSTSEAIAQKTDITKLKADIIKLERGKVYDINDILPLGDICTLEELHQKLLKKFDMKSLMCEWAACVPDIPWPLDIDWDLDFSWKWPRLPTFDLYMLYPIIIASIAEMILRILCSLVNKILESIKFPNCDELFEAAMYGISSISDAIKEHHEGTVGISLYEARPNVSPLDSEFLNLIKSRDKAEIAAQKSYMQTLVNVGIPQEFLVDNEVTGDSVAGLVENISKIMTPTELCTLMRGTPSDETLSIVREIIRTSQSSLESFFPTNESVETYFSSLGALVGPEVCEKLEQIPDQVANRSLCVDEEGNNLRARLLDGGATADQVRNALAIAAAESERVSNMAKSLASANPLSNLPPTMDFSNPNSIISDLPPAFMNMVEEGTTGLLNLPKSSYLQEIVRYVPSLYETTTRSLDTRDPEFNTYYRVKAKEAMAILQDFEPYADMLSSEDILDNFVARSQLYVRYAYQVHYWEYIPPTTDNVGNTVKSYWTRGVANIPQEHADDPTQITRILERYKARKVGVPAAELAGHEPRLDLKPANSSPAVLYVDTAGASYERLSESAIRNLLPSISGKVLSRTEPTSILDEPQLVIATREIKDAADVNRVKDAQKRSDVEGSELAVPDFKKTLMADVESRLSELRSHIMRDLEVNQGDRTQQEVSPALVDLFSREGEARREGIQEALRELGKDIPIENFTYNNSEVVMRLPSLDGNLENDSYVRYSEIPSTNSLNSIVTVNIEDKVLTNSSFTSTHCDPIRLPGEGSFSDFSVPYGQYMRPEAFYHMVRKSAQGDLSRYGIPALNEDQLRAIRSLVVGDIYPKAVESFVEEVFNYLSQSPIFEPEKLLEIENRIRGKSTTDDLGCTTVEKGMIDFDMLISRAVDSVKQEYKKPENSPDKIDFSRKGPFEKGMLAALVNMLIDVLLIEFSLRGAVSFSAFSAEKLLNEKSIEEYLLKFINTSIEKVDRNISIAEIFKRQIRKDTKMPRDDSALREAVLRRLGTIDPVPADDSVSKMIDRVFGTKFDKISISDRLHVAHVPRAWKVPIMPRSIALGSIKLPMLSDARRKGRFYLETYVRILGAGAGSEFGTAEEFSREFQEFIDTFRDGLSAAAEEALGEAGLSDFAEEEYRLGVESAADAIDQRLDELQTIEPLRSALDDNFKVNGKDTELVHIDEIAEFIRRTYHSGFNKELCDIVGAIYSEDPMDACYLAPIETYRYPTRMIKKTRRYIRLKTPGSKFNVSTDGEGRFRNAAAGNFELITKSVDGHAWKYYSVPANYCDIRKEYNTEEEYSAVLSNYSPAATQEDARLNTFKFLNPSKYVDIAMPLQPLDTGAPSEELGAQIVNQMLGAITGKVYQELPEGYDSPGKRYPITGEEASSVERSRIGLAMKKVNMLDTYGEPRRTTGGLLEEFHPLDSNAPWFHSGPLRHPTANKAFDNLGELTREKFESIINGEEETMLNQSPGVSGVSPHGIHEQWTEFVIDCDMSIFNNPGESFHHPDEAPFVMEFYNKMILDTLHTELADIREQYEEDEGLVGLLRNELSSTNLYPFNMNVNISYSSVFKKEIYRPDIHTSSEPLKALQLDGFSVCRPFGHTPLSREDSAELGSNQFAIPVRVLVTRVDYKSGDEVLDTEIFVNYDIPETAKGSTVEIKDADSPNRRAVIRMNHGRKKNMQLGLNALLEEYFRESTPQLAADGLSFIVTSEEIRTGKYSADYQNKLKEIVAELVATGTLVVENDPDLGIVEAVIPEGFIVDGSDIRTVAEQRVRDSLSAGNRPLSIEPTYNTADRNILGPALTNTKIYSAAAWHDARTNWGWDLPGPNLSAEVNSGIDEAFYVNSPGILVENASAPGSWAEVFNLNIYDGGAIDAEESVKVKLLVDNYLTNFVDRRSYAGIWGKTSSPWHLWGGFGYIPSVNTHTNGDIEISGLGFGASGGVNARKEYISNTLEWYRPQSALEVQYDASDIYEYIEQNSQYLGMFEAARINERHLHLVNYNNYDRDSFGHVNHPRQNIMVPRATAETIGGSEGVSFRQHHAFRIGPDEYLQAGSDRKFNKFCYIDWNSRYKLSMNPRNHAKYIKHFPYDLWFYHDNNLGKDMNTQTVGSDASENRAYLLGKNASHNTHNANLVWRMKPGGVHWEVLPIPDPMASWDNRSYDTPAFEEAYTGFTLEDKNESLSLSKSATTLGTKPNSTDNLVYGDGYYAESEFDISLERYNLEARGYSITPSQLEEKIKQGDRNDAPLTEGAGFSVYARNALISLMLRAQQTEESFWQTLSAFGNPNEEGSAGIFSELNSRLDADMKKRLEMLFQLTQYNAGVRLVYITPENSKGRLEQTAIKSVIDIQKVAREERAWKTDYIDMEFPEDRYVNAVNFPLISHEVPLDVRCKYLGIKEEFSKLIPQAIAELTSKEEYKILTEYSFPLDRYATLSSVYSVMALSRKSGMEDLLRSTKSSIARLMLVMENRPAFGEVADTHDGGEFRMAMMSHLGPDGPEGVDSDIMDKFGDFIGDLAYNAAMSPLWMLRSMASKLDPAMKDMKKLAKSPECELKGVQWRDITASGLSGKMNKGVSTGNEYAPVNTAFPYDLATNLLPYPPFVTKDFFKALHKFGNFVIKDKVPKLPPGAAESGLKKEALDRYGSFLGPLGLLSLGIAYMPGEEDLYKKCVFPKPLGPPPADSGTPC